MHAAPAATRKLQYTYRTLAALAALCWAAGGGGIAERVSGKTEALTLSGAITATISAVLLQGIFMILRRHENTTLLVLGALAAEITREPGGGAPTGPFPRLAPVRQRDSA